MQVWSQKGSAGLVLARKLPGTSIKFFGNETVLSCSAHFGGECVLGLEAASKSIDSGRYLINHSLAVTSI